MRKPTVERDTYMSEQTVEQNVEQVEKTAVDPKAVVYLTATDERIEEKLRAAVEAGDIRCSIDTVDVKVSGAGDTKKTVSGEYVRYEALTTAGQLALMDGVYELHETKPSCMGRFNYAEDLYRRGLVRTALLKKAEGPEKAIERGIKGLVAAGFSESKAIATVLKGLIEEGELPADYVYSK